MVIFGSLQFKVIVVSVDSTYLGADSSRGGKHEYKVTSVPSSLSPLKFTDLTLNR